MYFKDKFFTQLLCNFFQIIPAAFCLWSKLSPEDIKVPNLFGESELPFIIKYSYPGPFESFYDYLYNLNVRVEEFNNRGIKEKMFETRKEEADRKNTKITSPGDSDFENLNGTSKNRAKIKGTPEKQYSKTFKLFNEKINFLKNQIKALKKVARFIQKFNKNYEKLKGELSPVLRKWIEEIFEEENEDKSKRNKENRMMLEGSGFKGMNNVSYNNQYQIGAIFIINRLSEEKEDRNSKLNRHKGTGAEIFNDLTDREMKELLLQTLNYLNSNGISQLKETPSINEFEINFLKELLNNFSKMFGNSSITLKEINQMSKIIDFVERYHGIVGKSASVYDLRETKTYKRVIKGRKSSFRRFGVKREREMMKMRRLTLCCGHEVNVFQDRNQEEFPLLRRKGFFR